MHEYTQPINKRAIDAKSDALKIAFSPIIFQVSYALLKLDILKTVGNSPEEGMTSLDVAQQLNLSEYGVKLLLDVGISAGLFWVKDDRYILDKTGHFILTDSMVKTNMDFMQDVCYQGIHHLIDSIKSGKPEGLKVFGDWNTIYPALSTLPSQAKESWFNFDHYYSDKTFPEVLSNIFSQPVNQLFDIGGNTGKWALECLKYDSNVKVTIIDLPEQIQVIKNTLSRHQYYNRLYTHPINMLDDKAGLPKSPDVIWMSQFLDCFSEEQILSILIRAVAVRTTNTRLYILELFWDRQKYEAAAFTINCTSIYFTCMANGNSRMYHSKDMLKLILKAGLYIDDDIDHLGPGHTLLCCKKKP